MLFQYNRYTALLLVAGTVEFLSHSSTEFTRNYGQNGGAVAMYGFSAIKLNPFIDLTFSKNYAINKGGAVYHSTDDQRSFFHFTSRRCFIEMENEPVVKNSVQVLLVNNTAMVSGAAIYSDSFDSCANFCMREKVNLKYSYDDVFNCMGNFTLINSTGYNNPVFTTSGRVFNFTRSCSGIISKRAIDKYRYWQESCFFVSMVEGSNVHCRADVTIVHKPTAVCNHNTV